MRAMVAADKTPGRNRGPQSHDPGAGEKPALTEERILHFLLLRMAAAGDVARWSWHASAGFVPLSAGMRHSMSEPSLQELNDSIEVLAAYRDRLVADVTAMGQRLKLPQKQVDATLASNAELQRIEAVLTQLLSQRDTSSSI